MVQAIAIALLLAALALSGALAPLQRLADDALLRACASVKPPAPAAELPDVVLVALDPQSLRALPEWPWPRAVHARLVERLGAAGARAIGFDVDFSTPRDPQQDAALARAVEGAGRVALAVFRQRQILAGGGELEVASLPFPALGERAAALGSVSMPVDPDGVIRTAPRATPVAGARYESLAAAVLALALREAPEPRAGSLRIDYRRARPAVAVLSAIDVLEGRFDPRDVAGRSVLVGATAAEFQDLWSTPLGPARPGVWIQALLYRTLAAERAGLPTLRAPSRLASVGALVLLSLLASAGRARSHARRIAWLGGLAAVWLALDAGLLIAAGLLVDPVAPLAAIGSNYVAGLEGVRRRFGRKLVRHERLLATLQRVGETTTAPAAGDSLGVALSLLADVVDASGVALLRADETGRLDGRRVEWRREGSGPVADRAVAEASLAARRPRVVGDGRAVYSPLVSNAGVAGVLVVERACAEPLDLVQERTLATVGAQLALSVDNLRLIERLRASFDSTVAALATAVEARDGYTEIHCQRLAVFSAAMADRLRLPEPEIEQIRLGALLHDVGKIGIRDEILLKPGRFTGEELRVMQSHAEIGHRIAGSILGLSPTTLSCVRHHHERWDGTGYPDRLRAEEIGLGARIVAIVDVWDALSTARPYKPAYDQRAARQILAKSRGTHFDPALVDLFLELLEEEGQELLAFLGPASPDTEGDA